MEKVDGAMLNLEASQDEEASATIICGSSLSCIRSLPGMYLCDG